MGGKGKSGGSFFGHLFRRGRRSSTTSGDHDDQMYGGGWRAWTSDEDKAGRYVADPRIDTKASAFIAHFHAARFSESEQKIFHCTPASN
ncbi:hypothetical protein LINPERPRIM_LOCUS1566 [Linum perenne]